ncbi:MAG TPA: hypothetical protein VMG40_13135 [Bryobacteraceae bacterium]|nr:hypothetical protein [Bryobacteraceae bacterium]
MTKLLAAFACAFAATGLAQVGNYLGPGVMSNGAGTIGQRSGSAVDLRFFADVAGFYDTGYTPYEVNSKGQLVTLNGLYGEQIEFGAYGTHTWRDALVGLNFTGSLYHFDNFSQADGSYLNLTAGYTWQKSRHWVFDLRGLGGLTTLPYSFGYAGYYEPTAVAAQPTSVLFDNRFYFVQSGADMTYVQSARTSYTAGADGFLSRYQGPGLAGMEGFDARGTIQHRLSKTKTVGFTYTHFDMNFTATFGHSDTDMGEAFFATSLGKHWTFRIMAGTFHADVSGVHQIAINPVIAALLGTSAGYQTFYRSDFYPAGNVNLEAKLKNSSLGFNYLETVVPGNGIYLTSRQTSGTAYYSYTGIKKWNLGISGGYYSLNTIGQGFAPYSGFSGGAGFTYGLSRMFHIVGRYDYRRQEIVLANGFRNNSYRASLGLAFSPGDVPLSLW